MAASGPQVGTAWIAITPSFQGFGSSITTQLTGELTRAATRAGDDAGDAAGRRAGDSFGDSFGDRVSSLGDSLAGPGALAGGIAAGGFAMGLANAMDTSAANARVTAQLGLTEAEAQRVGDAAGAVFADGWGGSMDEAAQAVGTVITSVTDLGSVSDAELTELTSTALALADVFQWDVSEAATAAGTLIRNGLAADATEAFDVMTAAAQAFPASMVADIPATIQEYSEQFQRLGLDAQTSFGLMSQFVQAGGRDIDQAADVIHEFARITSEDTAAAAAAFQSLGLDADATLAAIHSGGPEASSALGDVLDALRGIENPADRAALAVELFGDMAGESSDALFAMDPATAAASAGLDDVAGASAGVRDALGESAGAQFESAMRSLSSTLGEALLPVLQGVGDFASAHPQLFQFIALGVLAAAAAFAVLTVAVWAINTALLANPVVWIVLAVIAAIAALAAAVALVIIYWDEIVAATQAAWDWVWNAVSGVVQWISDLVASWNLVGMITGAWNSITSSTSRAWTSVRNAVSGAWTSIRTTVTNAVTSVRNAITGAWTSVRTATSNAWTSVRTAVVNGVLGAWNAVRNVAAWFRGIGRAIVSGIASGVRSAAQGLINSVRNLASSALDSVRGFLGIGSPSRVFASEVGQWIPAGIEVGIAQGEPELTAAMDRMVTIPDPPTVRATVATGTAATAAPTLEIVAGDRNLRAWLEEMVRTQLGGDVTRLGRAR